jgi:hypothetical protein
LEAVEFEVLFVVVREWFGVDSGCEQSIAGERLVENSDWRL